MKTQHKIYRNKLVVLIVAIIVVSVVFQSAVARIDEQNATSLNGNPAPLTRDDEAEYWAMQQRIFTELFGQPWRQDALVYNLLTPIDGPGEYYGVNIYGDSFQISIAYVHPFDLGGITFPPEIQQPSMHLIAGTVEKYVQVPILGISISSVVNGNTIKYFYITNEISPDSYWLQPDVEGNGDPPLEMGQNNQILDGIRPRLDLPSPLNEILSGLSTSSPVENQPCGHYDCDCMCCANIYSRAIQENELWRRAQITAAENTYNDREKEIRDLRDTRIRNAKIDAMEKVRDATEDYLRNVGIAVAAGLFTAGGAVIVIASLTAYYQITLDNITTERDDIIRGAEAAYQRDKNIFYQQKIDAINRANDLADQAEKLIEDDLAKCRAAANCAEPTNPINPVLIS